MRSIKIHSFVGEDGILHLDIPVGLINQDVELMLIYQPIKTSEELGWSSGFFEKTFGAWEGELLVRSQEQPQERNWDDLFAGH